MMDDDSGFLDALRADSRDDTTRLVYADWLEERNDPRAEYLRLMAELTAEPSDDLVSRLQAVAEDTDREWREVVGKRFDLVFESVADGQKIRAVASVRFLLDVGLKEAKDLVEAAPVVIERGLLWEDAVVRREDFESGYWPQIAGLAGRDARLPNPPGCSRVSMCESG